MIKFKAYRGPIGDMYVMIIVTKWLKDEIQKYIKNKFAQGKGQMRMMWQSYMIR